MNYDRVHAMLPSTPPSTRATRPSIYLDHQATTPVDPRVLEVMLPTFTTDFGNAASRSHRFGHRAEQLVETAREEVAATIGAAPHEIVFTSGATEALNLALKGAAAVAPPDRRHLVTCATEHPAVLDTVDALEASGFEVSRLAPGPTGRLSPEALEAALGPETLLVSLMWANNEVGTVHPIEEIGALCRARGILFLTDATQAVGKLPVDVRAAGVDLLSLSAHKLYGPKGAGALFVRRGVRLALQQHGGGHERGMRSGTLNVPGIVGLGAACRLASEGRAEEALRLQQLRDRLETGLVAALGGSDRARVHRNGDRQHGLPGCLHLSFEGVSAADVQLALPEIALSSGAACSSGKSAPSHVLRAMGVPDDRSHGSLRFGLGRHTTAEEIEIAIRRVSEAVLALRGEAIPDTVSARSAAPHTSPGPPPGVSS